MLTCSVAVEYSKESCPLLRVGVFKSQGATEFCQWRHHGTCWTWLTNPELSWSPRTVSAAPVPPGPPASASCASGPRAAGLQGGLGVFLGRTKCSVLAKSDKAFAFKPSSLVQSLIHTSYFCLMGFISQFWYISIHVKAVTCGRCLRKRNWD